MSRAFFYALAGHLLLAFAAFLMVAQTAAIFPASGISMAYKMTILISTFILYRLAYYGLKWPVKIYQLIRKKEIVICLGIVFFFLPSLRRFEIYGFILMAVCCFAYILEIGNWKGVRSFPVIKSIWLALVWTATTVMIPLAEHLEFNAWLLFSERFLFILSLCIIYNLRDTKADFVKGIFTIPHKIGVLRTKQLSLLILLVNGLIVFYHHYPFPVFVAWIFSLVVTAVILFLAKEGGHLLYYSFAVDACMILQSLLVIGAYTL